MTTVARACRPFWMLFSAPLALCPVQRRCRASTGTGDSGRAAGAGPSSTRAQAVVCGHGSSRGHVSCSRRRHPHQLLAGTTGAPCRPLARTPAAPSLAMLPRPSHATPGLPPCTRAPPPCSPRRPHQPPSAFVCTDQLRAAGDRRHVRAAGRRVSRVRRQRRRAALQPRCRVARQFGTQCRPVSMDVYCVFLLLS